MLSIIIVLNFFPSFSFQSLKTSFLSTKIFFYCPLLSWSYSDFSSSSPLWGGSLYYSPTSSYFMLTLKNKHNNQIITFQLRSWLCIFWCFSYTKSLFILLLTDLINNNLCSFFVNNSCLSGHIFFTWWLLYVLICFYIVHEPLVFIPHLNEKLFNLSKWLDLNIFHLTFKVLLSYLLLPVLLIWWIRIVSDPPSACQSVMHC